MWRVLSAKPSTALRDATKNATRNNRIFVVLMFIAYSFSFKLANTARFHKDIHI
jgi:hypothetical protein